MGPEKQRPTGHRGQPGLYFKGKDGLLGNFEQQQKRIVAFMFHRLLWTL